jgi:hypothetical protein
LCHLALQCIQLPPHFIEFALGLLDLGLRAGHSLSQLLDLLGQICLICRLRSQHAQ